ncbi:MAG: hypothetical protein ACLFTZ_03970 [Acholeplasmataceae bacterium]
MKEIKFLKKAAVLALIIAGTLLISACGESSQTPYGDISDETVYMTVDDIEITEKDLYDQLRFQGAEILATMIDETILADEIETVTRSLRDGDEALNEEFDGIVNEAIHQDRDEEKLAELYADDRDRFNRNIEQYVDSLYLLDNTLDTDGILQQLLDLADTADNAYSGYAAIDALVGNYELRLAQRNYAEDILEDEVEDEESEQYVSDEDVLEYYKENRLGQYDVDALVIRFINLNEANAALHRTSLKVDSRGRWYEIPDIRIDDPEDPNHVDLTDESSDGYGHVKDILEELNILSQLGAADQEYPDRDNISSSDYEDYYKKYTIDTDRNDGLSDESLVNDEVKEAFVEIYNILNETTPVEITEDGDIVYEGSEDSATHYTYEDLDDINSSLRSHIYNTLISEEAIEDPDLERPYSSRVQSFGNSRYLVYKLGDDSEIEGEILVEDEENEDEEVFDDTEEAEEIQQEIRQEILESKLTSDYVSSKIEELYEEIDLDIYDRVVRAYYEQSYDYEGSTDNRGGDVVAKVNDTEITTRDFFNRLERSFGINLSLDLASNEYLLNHSDYSISEEDREDYEEQFKDIIRQFSADQFASSGFPASMGREEFLLLAFGVNTNSEAVNQLYIYPELRNQYLEDFEAHFHSEDYTIYEKLADLAEEQYDHFKSINVSHLLVYFDEDGDGTPDDPSEYLADLTEENRDTVLTGLEELVEEIYDRAGNYTSLSEGLETLSEQFNNSGRIERGRTSIPYDITDELTWAEYRRLGFYLKYEPISNAITNTSNFITGQNVLDTAFYDRAMTILDQLEDMYDDESRLPYLDLYDDVIDQSALDSVMSSFGWHFILATDIGEKDSAIYPESRDTEERYTIDDVNVYNEDSETLTPNQIEFYLVGEQSDEGAILPSSVQSAVSSFLRPVMDRYQGEYMQRELVFKLLEDAEFTSDRTKSRFNRIRDINRRQLDDYMLSDVGYFDENYDDLYGDWFEILEATTKP